jgi:hypothetical protein
MPLFDLISITSAMVLKRFVCDERSGLCRVYVMCNIPGMTIQS